MRNRRGFTLIEVLLAVSIFAVIAGSLYFSLRSGLLVFQRAEVGLSDQQTIRLVLARIEKDLRNALRYEPIPFEGKGRSLAFPTVIRSFERNEVVLYPVKMSYEYREGKLMRITEPISDDLKKKKTKETILEDLQSVQFRYGFMSPDTKEPFWKEEWSYDETALLLPKAVSVKFKFKKNSGETILLPPETILIVFQGEWGTEKDEELSQ